MASAENRTRLSFDDYVLDVARRELGRGSEPVAVEPQVFDLLVYLAQNPDRVIGKDELLQAVWDGRIVTDSAITNRINAARRAIGDSGEAQRLIRTVPRKGYRFIGIVDEGDTEPPKAAIPPNPPRRRAVAPAFSVAAASALLGAAIAAFLLWPAAGPPRPWAVPPDSGRAPITASAADLRLISGLSLTVPGNGADQLRPPVGLADIAIDLQRGRILVATLRGAPPVHLAKAAAGAQVVPFGQEAQPPLPPNVTAIAPLVPTVAATATPAPNVAATLTPASAEPLSSRNAGKSSGSNSFAGRYRVEEERFPEVPCTAARIASSAGGRCLRGYRGLWCDRAIDVVMYTTGVLSVEASTLIFDPYKLAATGFPTRCSVAGQPAYDQEDFQDMNQVTRRGSNWRNFSSNGEEKSIEFSDGGHNCVAVHQPGPKWQGGYVYMLHASICHTDTAPMRAEDVAYALGLLQVRQDDPVANLRTAGR